MTTEQIAFILAMAGVWIFGDGIVSLILYLPDEKQSWGRDHWLRVVRSLWGVVLICLGWTLLK